MEQTTQADATDEPVFGLAVPTGQLVQLDMPAAEAYVPLVQVVQVFAVAPTMVLTVPAAHAVQADWPAEEA